ncbi:GNAT family N-acetyltransferase [Oligoflexus tunisiensis]|uniref:GNAT family N-acetyltransferase n=1 Tax=Oligoflexus tunisiensis TaxID=708132 RepID=UPI001C4054C8|nr:GNAT family N-acetyltransferase [Oligoflexus tunisiensis]
MKKAFNRHDIQRLSLPKRDVMALSYRIREAALDDNERLIELIRRCPMRGQLQVYLDRYPDFFAMTRLQGDRSYIYVAEDMRGDLVGSVVLIERQEYWKGKQVKVLHIGDLRTHPAWRGTRIAAKFVEIYRQKLLSEGYHHGSAEIMEGNIAPVKAQRLLGDAIKVCYDGAIDLYQLLPIWNYRPSKQYRYRKAEATDLPAIAALLSRNYENSPGAPAFTEEYLARCMEAHGSFGLQNIWIAENETGEILACLGTWDQKSLRRTVAVRLSRFFRLVVRLLAWLGAVWKVPPVPVEGRPLRYLYLRWPACQPTAVAALRNLIRVVMREVRQQGEHQFVAVGFHENDRLKQCLRAIIRVKTKVHLFSHQVKAASESPALVKASGEKAPYVDVALI